MSMLFYLFPVIIAYAVFRGVGHLRKGRQMWAYQFFILAGFLTLFFGYEIYLQFIAGKG